ncbi:hypothetical protein UPYG_G00105430 [Umbra pygmaea]|uniref:Uncharacterized protein n=1 Tax=Umbra pygmaea TaxID=75934 RepID=A0ABD0X2S5_UMBPY
MSIIQTLCKRCYDRCVLIQPNGQLNGLPNNLRKMWPPKGHRTKAGLLSTTLTSGCQRYINIYKVIVLGPE